jgi:hypothetical protein
MAKGEKSFDKYPENINRTGANKGSKWKSTLLKEIFGKINFNDETEAFAELKTKFPEFFTGSEKQTYQFFMYLKLVSMAFDKDPKVALKAVELSINRVDGSPRQSLDISGEQIKPVRYIDATGSD